MEVRLPTTPTRSSLAVGLASVLAVFALAGCGGAAPPGDATVAPSTPAAASTESPEAAAAPEQERTGDWQTVVTLRSSDPTEYENLHISEPFTVDGDVRLVLDMPDGKGFDGVIVAIVDADKTDPLELLKVIGESKTVTLVAESKSLQTEEVSGLKGSFRLINSVPTEKAWAVEVQTKG